VAITRTQSTRQVWLFDIRRSVLTQLTRTEGASFNAHWMPDSRSLFHIVETPTYDLGRAPIDGTKPDTVVRGRGDKLHSSISPDGKTVIVAQVGLGSSFRLMLAPVGGGPVIPLDSSAAEQRNGAFSPDGRWLAFDERGADDRWDVYVRRLGGDGGRRQVSADGGDQARWSRGGREIVYRKGEAVYAASFEPATGEVGTPALLFRKADAGRLAGARTIGYDVSPDGSQFLMVTPVERVGSQPVVVVINWLDELKKKVPR
jgi:Tol biopolymer transport system component